MRENKFKIGYSMQRGLGKRYNEKFFNEHTVYCTCGHAINITNRYRREICSFCGKVNYLTKKDEYMYTMKRKCGLC